MKYLIVVIALALSACGGMKVVSATSKTVVINVPFDTGVSEPLQLAEKECKKHGLSAVLVKTTSPTSSEYVFECVR